MVTPLSWVCAHDAEAGCEKVTKAKPREWLVILSRMTCACRGHAVRGNGQCHEAPRMSTQAKTGCISAMKARPHAFLLPLAYMKEHPEITRMHTVQSCQMTHGRGACDVYAYLSPLWSEYRNRQRLSAMVSRCASIYLRPEQTTPPHSRS